MRSLSQPSQSTDAGCDEGLGGGGEYDELAERIRGDGGLCVERRKCDWLGIGLWVGFRMLMR